MCDIQEISINDIPGFKIGQAQNHEFATGCTTIVCEQGAICGVDVRGGSPGTRDTDALNPVNNREKTHAVLLSGGSAFGLDAAGGVMQFLEERKIGRDVAVTVVPNVCAAVLFDLKCGSSAVRPDKEMGYSACKSAFDKSGWQSGNYGAGTGATVGKIAGIEYAMKGGIGSSALRYNDLYVGAIIAVNCVGDVYDYQSGKIIAGTRSKGENKFAGSEKLLLEQYKSNTDIFSGNTVIGCIMTNANLTKAQSTKLASLGQNGVARVIRPAHTVFDGDTIFTMCSGKVDTRLDAVGILACRVVENAIIDAIKSAVTYSIFPSASDFKTV
jgi:L-aminopeptidase/D-esterase-like protein